MASSNLRKSPSSRLLQLTALFIGLLLAACTATNEKPSEALAEPTEESVVGTYTHQGSKMAFPEKVGPFQRTRILRYDNSGKDVSAGYDLLNPLDPIAATVYVYPATKVVSLNLSWNIGREDKEARNVLDSLHFEAVKKDIVEAKAGATQVGDDEPLEIYTPKKHVGKKATFKFATLRAQIPSLSEVYLFRFGNWYVKYRFSYPELAQSPASAQISEFVRALQWPEN